ncbi:MAG TPA: ferredoxin reductase family protein, partial [Thermoanaerobaculia bacterium]|nr:ferredoxin reductase family protein [Thermoanaerobaculia bacterium]
TPAPTSYPASTRRDPAPRWVASKAWGWFLAVLYPLLAAAPLVAFAALNPESDHARLAEVGAECAVVAFTILALQFPITARLSWVEAPFGLDVVLVFHRVMALVATALLCVHPVLLAQEERWELLTGLRVDWYVWVGRLALAILLLHVVVSLSRRLIRLPYDRWRRLHNPIALAVLTLGFVHSLAAGDDMKGGGLVVWCALMAVALGFWLYAHVARPRLLLRQAFRVVETRPEAPRVWTLTLEPEDGRPFHFTPGQFQFLRLHGAGVPSEEHPFTIASSPGRPRRISLTIKESGDFTAGIGRVRPGDRATVHGPFGRFSHTLHREEKDLVFVAGGVGITPFMSMLRHMRDRFEAPRVLLVYASRSAEDVLFAEELEAMEAGGRPRLRVVHVLADATPSWAGATGRVDADRVVGLCGGVEGKAFYLCGPPPMMKTLIHGLKRAGVSPSRVHADYFSL